MEWFGREVETQRASGLSFFEILVILVLAILATSFFLVTMHFFYYLYVDVTLGYQVLQKADLLLDAIQTGGGIEFYYE